MALIHILDKQSDKIIGTLNLGEYTDDEKVTSSENENTFDFTALKKFDLLQKRNRLLLQDMDGFFSEYLIIYAEQNSRSRKDIKSNATFTDLQKAKIIEPQTLQGATADTATTKALEGTEWKKGKVDYNGIRTLKIEEYTNPYNLLKTIASEFGLDLRFRVAVEGNKIARYVDLTLPDDEFDGKEVAFGKDLIGLRRIEDAQNIVTALLVLGPEQEDGKRLTVLVEDNDALQRWGRNGQHLIEVYEPQITAEEVTVERLRTLGQNALQKRIDALVTYECQAAILEHIPGKEHEKVRLDRTIRIKDEGYTPPLYLEAKVLEIKEQPSTGKILEFKLGNYKEFSKADLEAQIAGLKKLLAQKASNAKLVETYELALQQAEEKAAKAEENAKGYTDTVKIQVVEHANTVANQAENNAKEHADTVAGEAESNAKAYALSEANKAKIAAIQAAATDAQTKVNAAKTALEADIATKVDAEWVNGQLVLKENAITKSNTAPANPTTGQLWLDTSTTPNVLKRWTGSAWVKATPTSAGEVGAYTKTEVDNALNSKVSVTQYNTDMNGVVTRLNSAESRVTQTENEIATKVSNTQYQQDKTTINNNISQLQTKMSNAETSISQLSNQITLKANATDVYTKSQIDGQLNTVNQQISQLDAELTVQADQIASKVSRTEFESLQIGGRNLLRNTDFQNGLSSSPWIWDTWDFTGGATNGTKSIEQDSTVGKFFRVTTTVANANRYVYLDLMASGVSLRNSLFIIGQTYTVSLYIRTSVDTTQSQIYIQGVSTGQKFQTSAGVWKKVTHTFTLNNFNPNNRFTTGVQILDSLPAGTTIDIRQLKMEIGSKPTDWTPAPEDAETKITTLETRMSTAETGIQQTASAIELKANKTDVYTKTEVNNALANKADNTRLATVESRVTTAEASIKTQADAIALRALKTDVYTKTEADNKVTTAVNNAKSEIKLTTDSISQSVSSLQSTVNSQGTRLSSAESSITSLSSQIQSKVSQTTFESAMSGKENTVYKQNTAPAHANGRLWLDTSKTPNVLYRSNGSVWIKVTPTLASEVGAYSQADGNTLAGRLSTAESTITQQADLISQKVSKTDYNGNTIASLINQTATTIKLQAAKIALDGYVEAKHIKSLNGLNVGNSQFVVDANGNVKFAGNLEGASGTFKGNLETGKLVIGPESPDIPNLDDGMISIEVKMPERVSTDVYVWRDPVIIKLLNGNVYIDGQFFFQVNSIFSAKEVQENGERLVNYIANPENNSGGIRFANGVQICWGWTSSTIIQGREWGLWFPLQFIDNDYVIQVMFHSALDKNDYVIMKTRQIDTTHALLRFAYVYDIDPNTTHYVQWFAMGRWKS